MEHGLPRIRRNSHNILPLTACIGSFDGLHRGHQKLIEQVVAASNHDGSIPSLITFYPHPLVPPGQLAQLPAITSFRRKNILMAELGIQYALFLRFKSISELSAQQFLERLIRHFGVKHLIFGEDIRIGKGRMAGAQEITTIMKGLGAETTTFPLVAVEGAKIGSRDIRSAIMNGNVTLANLSLGRPYTMDGRRVKGEGRGTTIGIPTINLYAPGQVVPKNGVYVTTLCIRGKKLPSVTNIGNRPTFGGLSQSIETFCIDTEIDCKVREQVSIQFIERLRDEIKFPSIDDLKRQIHTDIDVARKAHKIQK